MPTIELYVGIADGCQLLVEAAFEAARRLRREYGITAYVDLVSSDVVQGVPLLRLAAARVGWVEVSLDPSAGYESMVGELIDAVLLSLASGPPLSREPGGLAAGRRPEPLAYEGAVASG